MCKFHVKRVGKRNPLYTHLGLHLGTHPEKRNPLYPIRAASFVSIALYVIFKPRPIYFR
jgi:hypothetical protein